MTGNAINPEIFKRMKRIILEWNNLTEDITPLDIRESIQEYFEGENNPVEDNLIDFWQDSDLP